MLIKLSDKIYVNLDRIAYINKNEFIGGTVIYFESLIRLAITDQEAEVLNKHIKNLKGGKLQ